MSETRPVDHISRKPVVLAVPGMDDVVVRSDLPYQDGDAPLTTDVYYPPRAPRGVRRPAVVFVSGGTDEGMKRALGCRFKDMGSTRSWARLLAASGMAAIAYTNSDASDVYAVLAHVRDHADSLGIDPERIGVWASSGNVPMALSVLMTDPRLACAVLLYGYMLDWPGSTLVAETLKTWGFANPAADRTIDALRADLPLFIARAGRDQFPNLNAALDRFAAGALTRNMPLTLVNHATGGHAFDILEDTDASRGVVTQAIEFLQRCLGASLIDAPPAAPRTPSSFRTSGRERDMPA